MLAKNGYTVESWSLPDHWKNLILNKNYIQLDKELQQLLLPEAPFYQELAKYESFSQIESMLALRDETDLDDGIWHDDGSRKLAFSLSLCLEHLNIRGGQLEIRKKGSSLKHSIGPLPYAQAVIFLTGQSNFEHRTLRVTGGERLIAAGWCS